MTITVPEDVLRQAGLSEREALVEFACLLFDAERLDVFAGARLAGLSRNEFESELRARRIAIYRPTLQDIEEDAAAEFVPEPNSPGDENVARWARMGAELTALTWPREDFSDWETVNG